MDSHLENAERDFGNAYRSRLSVASRLRASRDSKLGKSSFSSVYPIVWLDAVHYKVMDEKNRPVTRAIYNVLTLNSEGRNELLGNVHIQERGRQLRKATKYKGVLTSDTALEKLVYLAFTRMRKKWTRPVQN